MPNLLAAEAGLKLGPIAIETFFRHYLERKPDAVNDASGSEHTGGPTAREQDLLWRESFEIVKAFLDQATRHTVEELQEFSNARIPVAPWVSVKRVLVPLATCDAAAAYLIKALGGEASAGRVVGGTKWWQIRGLLGVDCQWIWQKSQMRSSKRKVTVDRVVTEESEAMHVSPSHSFFSTFRKLSGRFHHSPSAKANDSDRSEDRRDSSKEHETFHDDIAELDGTRCMLYAHGGGYYFGSVDQERYCMQRYARKIRGRVFALNYRLAPQYPFPCAIQDMLAAYLYLIDPPHDAMHTPIPPHLIVLGGDSAGGGLCLATLQVMRDSGLPLPAAAVLISPWGDLTHSFPSATENTGTDIIPPYGLCFHKPSILWPPPLKEVTPAGLRQRFKKKVPVTAVDIEPPASQRSRQIVTADMEDSVHAQVREATRTDRASTDSIGSTLSKGKATNPTHIQPDRANSDNATLPTAGLMESHAAPSDPAPSLTIDKLPLPWEQSDSLKLSIDGDAVTIDKQVQLYCPNSLLSHPLVSPVLGYLGGLPPLLVIAGDNEVLRDEIVYLAHKAAHPDRFPVNEVSKMLYPPLENTAIQYRPTPVHLQVYDETAHVLPLFAFTIPAKYCYRAIASFTKHVTPIPKSSVPIIPEACPSVTKSRDNSEMFAEDGLQPITDLPDSSGLRQLFGMQCDPSTLRPCNSGLKQTEDISMESRQASWTGESPKLDMRDANRVDSGDIAGSRFQTSEYQPQGPGTAGDPSVYADVGWPAGGFMIRERVSTRGVLRPLELEAEIPALNLPSDHIGRVRPAAARRYLTGQGIWTKKYSKTAKNIEKRRKRITDLFKGETTQTVENMTQLREHLFDEHDMRRNNDHKKGPKSVSLFPRRVKDPSNAEYHCRNWALVNEHPPPSSIVSRMDTKEAQNLSRVADLSMDQEESKMSGNMLWSVLTNFLTAHPDRKMQKNLSRDEGSASAKLKRTILMSKKRSFG